MEYVNSMRPPVTQLQSLQGKQRKRPHNPPLSPFVSSQASRMPNSPIPIDVGSASRVEAHQKVMYEAWTQDTQAQLFEWLELPGNYQKWKGAGVRSSTGSTRTSGLTKKAITCQISEHLDTVHTKKTPEQVMSKMRYVEKKFKEAEDFLQNTGEGLTSTDDKLGITVIREKVQSICPFYFQVKSFMCESVAVNPPYIGESTANENIHDLLFGTSSGPRVSEQRGNGNFEQDDYSGDEDPDFEDEVLSEQQPNSQPPSQDTPPVPETMPCQSTPNRQQTQKKKKPKSVHESFQEAQDQKNVLMGIKLEQQSAHKLGKLQFMREQSEFMKEQSEKQLNLEYRRLDLEFQKMEQQREDSRIRELGFQVELEKLRQQRGDL